MQLEWNVRKVYFRVFVVYFISERDCMLCYEMKHDGRYIVPVDRLLEFRICYGIFFLF